MLFDKMVMVVNFACAMLANSEITALITNILDKLALFTTLSTN